MYDHDSIISVRGNFEIPILVLFNSKTGSYKILEYPEIDMSTIPLNKRGFSGLKSVKNEIWVLTWDKIIKISKVDFKIIKIYKNKLFSDLHGLEIYKDNLYLANTNLDSIFSFSISSEKLNFLWNPSNFNGNFNMNIDYSKLNKDETKLHSLHINSISYKNEKFFISYLGKAIDVRFKSLRKFLGLFKNRNGGLFITDKKFNLLKSIKSEGLHDAFQLNSSLAFTEYFSNYLLIINPRTLKKKRLRLEFSEFNKTYLLRGGIQINNNTIIAGYSINRGKSDMNHGLIRYYNISGRFLNKEILIPNVSGIYEFCKI